MRAACPGAHPERPRLGGIRRVLAAWAVLLPASTGSPALAAGTPSSGTTAPWVATLQQDLAPLAALGHPDAASWSRLPVLHSRARDIPADGVADATDKIQAALDALKGGGTLVLDPGIYRQTRCLHLWHANIRILGRGATLHATDANDLCVELVGEGATLESLTLTAVPSPRGTDIRGARIVVTGRGAVVSGNTLRGATSAGIWVQGARGFAILGNHISDTMADGIHHSEGSSDGYVARNVLDRTGDDGIAVVSYRSSARCGRVLVEDNQVSDVANARGIAVVGSRDVIVRRNTVSRTGRAAGIIVTREPSYDTYGVDRVLVADNRITGVASLKEPQPTGQASIDLNAFEAATPELQVRRVAIVSNQIQDGLTDGIRLLGGVCDIDVVGNGIRGVAGASISAVDPACGPMLRVCRGNAVAHGSAVPDVCKAAP